MDVSHSQTTRPWYALTGYRLLFTTVTIFLGSAKYVLSTQDKAVLSNNLDFIVGVIVGLFLFWLGFVEGYKKNPIPWMFEWDYAVIVSSIFKRIYYRFVTGKHTRASRNERALIPFSLDHNRLLDMSASTRSPLEMPHTASTPTYPGPQSSPSRHIILNFHLVQLNGSEHGGNSFVHSH